MRNHAVGLFRPVLIYAPEIIMIDTKKRVVKPLARRLARRYGGSEEARRRVDAWAEGLRRVEFALLFAFPGGLLAAWWEGYSDQALAAGAALMLVWFVLWVATRHIHPVR